MSKSKVTITAGAVLLSAALAVSLFSAQESTPITPEQLLAWNCELEDQKPDLITITCADGGLYVEKIKWSTWTKFGATGIGILSED